MTRRVRCAVSDHKVLAPRWPGEMLVVPPVCGSRAALDSGGQSFGRSSNGNPRRMRSRTLLSWPCRIAVAATLCALPRLAMADAYQQVCDKGGDQLGSSIATNGDFNGDGR